MNVIAGHDERVAEETSFGQRYAEVRQATEALCDPLTAEDCQVQSMPEASPTKWHLAHTTWFFETFLLLPGLRGYRAFCEEFGFLFNSYYDALGPRQRRDQRGLLSRPSLDEVFEYRRSVDAHLVDFLNAREFTGQTTWPDLLEVGLNHEQQHQELILTDIKHLFAMNPLRPVYRPATADAAPGPVRELGWQSYPESLVAIGHAGTDFAYDNETPRHRVFLQPYELADRLITAGEYLEFIADGGYQRPELWLSLGWETVQAQGWVAPLYWERADSQWRMLTLSGLRPVDLAEPVCHVSYFEADAYARWAGARLPSEAEWEHAAEALPLEGSFVESGRLHPRRLSGHDATGPAQMFGEVWQWTSSPYTAYPGYRPPAGALGEYNGKFMCNQFVLRGGSCATPRTHLRASYRNFFSPEARWQFTGIRLARDV